MNGTRSRRIRHLILAALCAAALTCLSLSGGQTALSADRAGDPVASSSKKKKKRGPPATGTYRGVLDVGGSSVGFTLGRDGSLTGFMATGFNLDCYTNVDNGAGGVRPGSPSGTRVGTITATPLGIGRIPRRKLPIGRSFAHSDPANGPTAGVNLKGLTVFTGGKGGTQFRLLFTDGPGFKGSLSVNSASGDQDAVGTEICESGPLQWEAARNWRPGP